MNSRRIDLSHAGAHCLLIVLVCGTLCAQKAPFKSIFFHDSTNSSALSPWHPQIGSTVVTPGLLRGGVDEAAAGGADAFFLEPGLCWVPWWNGNFLPLDEQYAWFRVWSGNPNADFLYMRYAWQGGDYIKHMLDRARAKGLAAFVSYRMNDGNHKGLSSNPLEPATARVDNVPRFYIENQQLLLKRGSQYPAGWPSSSQFLQDWTHPEVRQWRLAMIKELCENYDMDGLNLDFLRAPYFFYPDPAMSDADRVAIMVDFIGKVRKCLDESRPSTTRKWLCVRIPQFLSNFGPMGIDPAAFKAAGVDMFILSAGYDFEQQTQAEDIKRMVPDCAVYNEITHSPQTQSDGLFRRATDSQIYTTANLSYKWGLDGMAFFNFQYYRQNDTDLSLGPWNEPPFRALGKVRDFAWLARQPQEYFLAAVRNMPVYRDPAHFQMGTSTSAPLIIQKGAEKTFTLKLARPAQGWAANGMLRIEMSAAMAANNVFSSALNAQPLASCDAGAEHLPNPNPTVLVADATRARAWTVPASLLQEGENTIKVTFDSGSDSSVTAVYLSLAIGTAQSGTFELGCDYKQQTVMAGSPVSWDVNTAMVDGIFNGTVTFSASGQPVGAAVAFSNASVAGPKTGATKMTVTTEAATPPGTYEITIHGTNGGVEKTTAVILRVEAPVALPAMPAGLRVAGIGRGEITLTWDPVPGASSYNIMSSRKARPASGAYRLGIEYQCIDTVTGTSITVPLLAGESVYYYFVSAVNIAGEGPASAQVYARTLPIAGKAPSIPGALAPVAIASGGTVVMHADADGEPAPAFRWQVSIDGGGHWQDLADGANYAGTQTASLNIKNASASMNGYLYRYIAVNSAGSATAAGATRLVMASGCFQTPTGVVVDADGNIYVTDSELHALYKMDKAGNVTVLAGQAGKNGFLDGQGVAAQFNSPAGLKIDPITGTLYIADTENGAIRSATKTGETGRVAIGFGMSANIAIDNAGNTYVADTANHAIRKIATDGAVTLIAGSGEPSISGTTNASGTNARFSYPSGVAVDAANFIYVADSGNHTIRYIRPSDNYVGTLAGSAQAPGCADGFEEDARFREPRGLVVDGVLMSGAADGSLYVADTGNSLIREITLGVVRTLAGHPGDDAAPAIAGVPGFQDGAGTAAWFRHPQDLALTKEGNLIVADTGNRLLRQVTFGGGTTVVVTSLLPLVATTGTESPGGGAGGVSGGGGGGALSWWWCAALSLLALARACGRGTRRTP